MQIAGESIGIVADDLTGACDTALPFHLEGGNTCILLDHKTKSQAGSTQTWILNTDSRHMEELDAVAATRKGVRFLKEHMQLERFYKKVDSTLRGNIAQECLAILDELRWKAIIVAPAYPDQGRITVGGYQIVHGVPVEQTEIARDPLFPVTQSHLPTILGNSSSPDIVGHISLSTVLHGAGPLLIAIQELIQDGKKLIVVDACSDTDLEQLALAINKMPSDIDVLPCGSAGLAKALQKKWLPPVDRPSKPKLVIGESPLLLVIGTTSMTTRTQVKHVLEHYAKDDSDHGIELVHFTPRQILGLDAAEGTINTALAALKEGKNAIITTSYDHHSVDNAIALAEENDLDPAEVPGKASTLLAEATQELLSQVDAKLLLSGGDTANTVCKTIHSASLQIIDEIATSIPLMMDEHARWVITKSGSFGDEWVLLNIIKKLRQIEASKETPHVS